MQLFLSSVKVHMSICSIVSKLVLPRTLEVNAAFVFHVFCCIFAYMDVNECVTWLCTGYFLLHELAGCRQCTVGYKCFSSKSTIHTGKHLGSNWYKDILLSFIEWCPTSCVHSNSVWLFKLTPHNNIIWEHLICMFLKPRLLNILFHMQKST